jgi:hypothetical protein
MELTYRLILAQYLHQLIRRHLHHIRRLALRIGKELKELKL